MSNSKEKLNEILKTVKELSIQQEKSNAQVAELYQLLITLNTKLDTIDQKEIFSKVRPPKKTKKTSKINKLEFFKMKYDEDPGSFDVYLTKEVKEQIAIDNEPKWRKLSPEKLAKSKRTAYYNYIKTHHDTELQSMKKSYIDDMNVDKQEPLAEDA